MRKKFNEVYITEEERKIKRKDGEEIKIITYRYYYVCDGSIEYREKGNFKPYGNRILEKVASISYDQENDCLLFQDTIEFDEFDIPIYYYCSMDGKCITDAYCPNTDAYYSMLEKTIFDRSDNEKIGDIDYRYMAIKESIKNSIKIDLEKKKISEEQKRKALLKKVEEKNGIINS